MTWLWVALVVAAVALLACCAVLLVRAFLGLLEAFGELLATPAVLDGVHRAAPEPRSTPAVLTRRADVAEQYRQRAQNRKALKDAKHRERIATARALISRRL